MWIGTFFTQRLINLQGGVIFSLLFKIPRTLKALMNRLYFPTQVGSLNILKDSQGIRLNHIVIKGYKKSLSSERYSNRPLTSVIMPSSAEKSRERVKKWKKENPEMYKEQKKRYKKKNAIANYEQAKTWRRKNPEKHLLQKQRERGAKRRKATEQQQHDSLLVGFQCTDETERIVNIFMKNVDHEQPLKVITFDCEEAIASEQQQQDAVSEFDLSLLDM